MWHVDKLWNSNSEESGLTKLNKGGNPFTVDSINYIKKKQHLTTSRDTTVNREIKIRHRIMEIGSN